MLPVNKDLLDADEKGSVNAEQTTGLAQSEDQPKMHGKTEKNK